ncbi:MAG: hypothetical protein ACMXYC_02215 [Candidatus Woesearchaeota archaeon]
MVAKLDIISPQIVSHQVHDVREELDEHLDAINSNTQEIQSAFEYVAEVENKVDKLAEKLDNILHLLQENKKTLKPLSLREQEVFLVLYTEKQFVDYQTVATKLQLPVSVVTELVQSLIQKGIPIIKKYEHTQEKIQVDESFKQEQAKHNVLHIHEVMLSSISSYQ